MQKKTFSCLFVLIMMLVLVSGCAKKAAMDDGQMAGSQVVEETQLLEQPVSIVEEQPIADVAAGDMNMAMMDAETLVRQLTRINFDYDQYVLTSTAQDILYANAQILKASPALKIVVEGHCDERGSDEYNLALGEKRAIATKNYLVSLGVSMGQLSTISYGEEVPLDLGRSEDAWAKNRRAEFSLQR